MAYNFYRNSNKKVFPTAVEFVKVRDQFYLYDLLCKCWCRETCAPRLRSIWKNKNKTCGQCSITAFLVQDIFGGEVYGIETCSGTHCFNKIGDVVIDLTSEQFDNPNELNYTLDAPQKRENHFAKEEKYKRYQLLKKLVEDKLN